jgi:hypothetical protein
MLEDRRLAISMTAGGGPVICSRLRRNIYSSNEEYTVILMRHISYGKSDCCARFPRGECAEDVRDISPIYVMNTACCFIPV